MYQKSTKRLEQAKATKLLIYNTADRLFQTRSFDQVTVEEIAAAAGVSVGAVYHHFSSKYEIMAMFHYSMDQQIESFYRQQVCGPALRDAPLRQRLAAMIRYICQVSSAKGAANTSLFYRYLFNTPDYADRIGDLSRPYFSAMQELFSQGQAQGQVRRDVPAEKLVADLAAVITGCVSTWCFTSGETPMDEYSASLIEIFLDGVAARS